MKLALIDVATGAVRQWQDHSLYGYPDADPAELFALSDDFVFPEAPHWLRGGVLTDVPPPPPVESHAAAQARALVMLRDQRGPILSILDGLQATANAQWIGAFTSNVAATQATADGFKTQAQQIEAWTKGLRDAPTAIDWAACADYEAMRQAGKAYYLSLVQGAPASVVTAFAGVAG